METWWADSVNVRKERMGNRSNRKKTSKSRIGRWMNSGQRIQRNFVLARRRYSAAGKPSLENRYKKTGLNDLRWKNWKLLCSVKWWAYSFVWHPSFFFRVSKWIGEAIAPKGSSHSDWFKIRRSCQTVTMFFLALSPNLWYRCLLFPENWHRFHKIHWGT